MKGAAKNFTMREGRSVFLYNEKSPYVRSSKGELGALRLDAEMDKVMCHECGEFFNDLSRHLRGHELSAKEYKQKHHLPLKTSLVNEQIRLQLVARAMKSWAVPENRKRFLQKLKAGRESAYVRVGGKGVSKKQNSTAHCRAQIVERIKDLGVRLGHTPSFREIRETYGYSLSLIQFRFGSLAGLQKAAKLVPNKVHNTGQGQRCQRYTDAMLGHMLQLFSRVHGRNPTASDCRRGYLPSDSTFFRRFGTWSNALRNAKLYSSGNKRMSRVAA